MFDLVHRHPTLAFISGFGPVLAAVMLLLVDHNVLTQQQSAYITTGLVAVASLITILKTTPLNVSAATGIITTLLTGLIVFNVNVPPDVIGFVVAALTFLAGHLWHSKVSPASATR